METLNPKVKRMIDANFNRAREGIRVVEDIARFVLDDRKLSSSLKQLRSELAEIEKNFYFTPFRDTVNDVGTKQTSPTEEKRSNLKDIAIANMKRVEESLRVLEEVFKLINLDASKRIKEMRYKAYTLEKETVERIGIQSNG